ncbi:MAG: nicotinate (nicotinamide) nucleotide adenylyltransferase [Spirochaetaceae bacterium]|nr:nicotinate (nicotinamide) nucleotide adenylyltransferase [Spirochaetaceae bacterium]
MKIAVLGGSFNPVHRGHIFLAETVVEKLGYGLVILVPAYISPFKQGEPAGDEERRKERAEERLARLLAAVEGKRRLTVDDCELCRAGVSYTIDTVADIVERYRPDGKPGLVIGDDLAAEFPRWRRAAEIAERCDLSVADRTGGGAAVPFPHVKLGNAVVPVSSSMVRAKIAKGEDWDVFAPEQGGNGDSVEAKVRAMLPSGRFLHSRNVALLAVTLAGRFGLNGDDAYLAGIAHDMAKELSSPLGHGGMAAAMLAEQYGVANEDVLEAVRCHTEGEIGMGKLAKIIYIADKVEPRRRSVEPRLREMCKTAPLEELFREIVRETHVFLERKGVVISENARRLSRFLEEGGGGGGE